MQIGLGRVWPQQQESCEFAEGYNAYKAALSAYWLCIFEGNIARAGMHDIPRRSH